MDQFYSCFKCTARGSQANQRKKIMEAGYRKTTKQFDVVSLMNKINLSFNVLKNVVTKEQKKLLKFNKSQVVDPRSSESSQESSEPDIDLQGSIKRKVNAKMLIKEKDVLK